MSLPKPCRFVGCKNKVTTKRHQGYCELHKHKSGWFINETSKGNRHKRGYGNHWVKVIRPRILERDSYLCQLHLQNGIAVTGTHVDHIMPKNKGGTDDDANLQTLCVDCHKFKTAKE